MFGAEHAGSGVDTVAHIIQAALTPVFLLSGIATLLNVFSTRLVRVADQVEAVSGALAMADAAESQLLARKLRNLCWRSLALDAAVILGAIGGAAICGAVLALFVGSLRQVENSLVLFGLFGLAVICALGGVLAFTVEMLIAGFGIRGEVMQSRRSAMPRMRSGAADAERGGGRGGVVPCRPAVRCIGLIRMMSRVSGGGMASRQRCAATAFSAARHSTRRDNRRPA